MSQATLGSRSGLSDDAEALLPNKAPESNRKVVVWSDLWASVPVHQPPLRVNPWSWQKKDVSTTKNVLKQVRGVALPGEILAIMGGSGAGKTTLLNILTGNRQKGVDVHGIVEVNGEAVTETSMRRMAAFVQQVDMFCGTLTVREQLLFSASLRMGRGYTKAQRNERVDEVLNEMNLVECQNTLIGIPTRTKGISVGEKKRLAFACEVLTDPSILFCDEPTSGLDSFMAQQVVAALLHLAARGKTIITVIHQPSAEVFELFHKVCFMANGRTAYHGPAKQLCDFLDSVDDDQINVPFDCDPADHMIKLLSIEPNTAEYDIRRVERITEAFETSHYAEIINRTVEGDLSGSVRTLQQTGNIDLNKAPRYSSSFFRQFGTLFGRAMLTCIRDPLLIKVKLFQVVVTALVIGLVNLQVPIRGDTIQNVEGALFNTARDMNFLFLFPSINVITAELPLFIREHKARIYSVESYYWSKTVAELPQYTIMPIIYSSIVYWMIGLYVGAAEFLKYVFICILQAYVAISIATAGACVFGEEGAAITFMPLFVLPMLVFGGFYINYTDIPPYFQWAAHLSWFRYGFEALQNNQWLAQYEIDGCTNVTNSTNFCPAKNGIEVLERRGMESHEWGFWMNTGILVLMFIVGRILGLIALKIRVRFAK